MDFKAILLGIISIVCLILSERLLKKHTLKRLLIFEAASVVSTIFFFIVVMDIAFSIVQVLLSFLFLILYNIIYCLVHKVPLNFIHSKGNSSTTIRLVTIAFVLRLAYISFV